MCIAVRHIGGLQSACKRPWSGVEAAYGNKVPKSEDESVNQSLDVITEFTNDHPISGHSDFFQMRLK